MDIYSILASKPHNPHYLIRYITFIQRCQLKNEEYDGYIENHHICPKAKDMFPEYKSFSKYPWNKSTLTPRQHFIAHLILTKVYKDSKSQLYAFNLICNYSKISSNIYEKQKLLFSRMISVEAKNRNNLLVKEGKHHFLGGEIQRRRVIDGTHHLLGKNNPCHEKIKNGTHVFLSEDFRNNSSKRMKDNNPMTKIKTNKGSFKKGSKPIITEERNIKISKSKIGDKNPNFGKKGCFDHLNNKRIQCPYCNIITTPGNIKRWHFDKCKHFCMDL